MWDVKMLLRIRVHQLCMNKDEDKLSASGEGEKGVKCLCSSTDENIVALKG